LDGVDYRQSCRKPPGTTAKDKPLVEQRIDSNALPRRRLTSIHRFQSRSQPIKSFIQPFATGGYGALYVPLSVLQLLQPKGFYTFCGAKRARLQANTNGKTARESTMTLDFALFLGKVNRDDLYVLHLPDLAY
jgi:hypothetical protein